MNLGIDGKEALICGASKGLGRACANALAAEGVNLTMLARAQPTLDKAADEIRHQYGVKVRAVAADIATEQGRRAALSLCDTPDILVTNVGGPPTGDFRSFSMERWQSAINDNMLAPLELICMTVRGMTERGFGRIVNITSWSVKEAAEGYALSCAPRLGLTGFASNAARSVAARNVTINNLLPGVFATERTRTLLDAKGRELGIGREELEQRQAQTIPAHRMGDPDEFGAVCAFLCSVHAGYMTGQNLLMDGGRHPGIF